MVSWFAIIMSVFIFCAVVAIAIIAGVIISRKKIHSNIPLDGTIFLNFNPKRTNGYAIGIQTSYKIGKSGERAVTEFIPRDFDIDEKYGMQRIIHEKDFRLEIPRGADLSQRRNFAINVPRTVDELPKVIRENTILGPAFTRMIILKRLEDDLQKARRVGDEARVAFLTRNTIKELEKETQEAISNIKKKVSDSGLKP